MHRVMRIVLSLALAGRLVAQDLPPAPAPIPELPGMGRPVDVEATRARRERLLQRIGAGVALVPAAPSRDLEEEVLQDNDFRQNDDFYYLTGLETPQALLVLARAPGRPDETVLFLPPRDAGEERWTGLRLGPGPEAARLSGIPAVYSMALMDSVVGALLQRATGPLFLALRTGQPPAQLETWGRPPRSLIPTLDSLRVVKDAAELARLRRAIVITAEAQREAMRAARPGMHEYQLEAVVEFTFRRLGADRVGFPSIIGSGPNTTTLHYDVNRRQTADDDLVVSDVGAEYGQYTADVTRTFPVNGRFTPRQRAIYELVLGAQQAALDAIRPGVTVRELDAVARGYLVEHGGTLCGARNCGDYFVHGLSHWLGMRVHDVGDYRMPLQPGMVLTVEPGVYLPEENLGVRIEDDVVVTATGYELLSAGAPRTPDQIEAVMREDPRCVACEGREP